MTTVLIVVGYLSGYYMGGVPSVTFQEFTGPAQCEAARVQILNQAKAWGADNRVLPFCVQK